MKIIAMGYVGTGSSAIVHLLKEYRNCFDIDSKNFEHNILYVPHGLFDLEDVLLKNNTLEKSDAALNDFYREMKNLNDYDFDWFGGFKEKYGSVFMNNVEEFIQSLIVYTRDGGWSYDYKYKFSVIAFLKDCIKYILKKKINKFGYRLDVVGNDNKVNFAFPTEDEFYSAAKKFINGYFQMIGCSENNVYIFDQLLKPQQLDRINQYFDDDVRFIVVDRDPRDTFLLCKYIWSESRPYYLMPPDVHNFIDFYSRQYNSEKYVIDNRILRIHFEDLIYKYHDTVSQIEDFIGKDILGDHVYKRKFFNPDISINNTQIFNIDPMWKDEIGPIETSELHIHTYDFPQFIKPNIFDVCDPDPDTSIKSDDIDGS